jgi:hypothetical protein
MLKSVRIEVFLITSAVADAVGDWFLPSGSCSAVTMLVGSSLFFFPFLVHLTFRVMSIGVHSSRGILIIPRQRFCLMVVEEVTASGS